MMLPKIFLILCLLITVLALDPKREGEYRTHWGHRKPPLNPHPPRVFEINLDLPYEERWKEVIEVFKPAIEKLLSKVWMKNMPIGFLDHISYPLAHSYSPSFAEEIKALAKLSGISFTKIFFLNFMYDVGSFCSSILVQDPSDNVILARTLDFGLSPYIADLIFHGKYYKNGKLLYEAVDAAGYLGLVTAQKHNAFALSINEYFVENEIFFVRHIKLFTKFLKQLLNGKLTPPYIVRKGFEQAEDYDSFIKILTDAETTSRVHYIIAGAQKGQGAVITKFHEKVENMTTLDTDNGRWFIVQTNYQRDVPDPHSDNRRTAATDRLEAIGKNEITIQKLTGVINQYPNFNAETIHTTIMQPNSNYINTTIWF